MCKIQMYTRYNNAIAWFVHMYIQYFTRLLSWLIVPLKLCNHLHYLYVRVSPKALCCAFEQDTLSSAKYWFNPGRQESIQLVYCIYPKYSDAFEPRHQISNNVVCATSKGSDQPAHTRSLIRAFASRLNIL